ncbi:MAG: hypothetical protein DRJ47_07975 [Thermoprotei archaeon]|nr:MAG: hypothetical protein DRJ47_07975 [Thermoprotei archaeon]
MDGYVFSYLHNLDEFENYVDFLVSSIRDKADKILADRFRRALMKSDFRRKRGRGIAEIYGYITASGVRVVSEAGIPIHTSVVSNPSIGIQGNNATLYLRLASIGSEFSRTFIASAQVSLEALKGEIKAVAKPILYGLLPYECVEDPRVDPVTYRDLYHVRAMYMPPYSCVLTFRTRLEYGKPKEIEAVHFMDSNGDVFLLRDYRDTFPLNKGFITVRPYLREYQLGGIFIGPRRGAEVSFSELRAVPELLPKGDERKTGGNTSLKLSSNEYLLFYHAVDKHGVYYTYVALFDENAELLALTRDPVIAPDPGVYSGRRPSTVFVCGAIKHGNVIFVTAGRDDEIAIIYRIEEEKMYEKLLFLKNNR